MKRRVIISNFVFRYEDKEPYVASGFSILGAIELGVGNTFKCHECGNFQENLSTHVKVHRLTAAQYRERHGLKRHTRMALRQLQPELTPEAKVSRTEKLLKAAHSPAGHRVANFYKDRVRHELRNLRGLCQAQIKKRMVDISTPLGRAPTTHELKVHHLYPQHLFQLMEVQNMQELLDVCGLPYKARGPGGSRYRLAA